MAVSVGAEEPQGHREQLWGRVRSVLGGAELCRGLGMAWVGAEALRGVCAHLLCAGGGGGGRWAGRREARKLSESRSLPFWLLSLSTLVCHGSGHCDAEP